VCAYVSERECVSVCVCVLERVCVSVYVRVYVYVHMITCVYVYVYVYTYVGVRAHLTYYLHLQCTQYTHTQTHTHSLFLILCVIHSPSSESAHTENMSWTSISQANTPCSKYLSLRESVHKRVTSSSRASNNNGNALQHTAT